MPYLRGLALELQPERVLDVGCGSGIYVTALAAAWQSAHVIGIDVQPAAVRRAAATVQGSDVSDRCAILQADILNPCRELDGPFDLVMLNNNLYYFSPDDRLRLFRLLQERLRPGGNAERCLPLARDGADGTGS